MKQSLLGIIAIIIVVGTIGALIGSSFKQDKDPVLKFEEAAQAYPTGTLGIPPQWFMMESLLGWERMMFIFGYADNREICEHLVDVASEESPERRFRCDDAN